MSLLLQISDPHFGTERPEVVEGLLRLARAERPDLVVLSGDITQRATRRQFMAARAFCESLRAPALLALPGNHDIPLFDIGQRVLRPYGRYRAAFGPALEGEWSSADMLVLTLNTTRPWRHKDGVVSTAQIERVAQRMAAATPAQWRVVVVHQPMAVTRPQDERDLMHGHARALRRWCEAGVDVVLGGHIHLPYVVGLHERDASFSRPMWVAQAGTAVSSRVRHEAGNSVNLLRRAADDTEGQARRCRLERWDWQEDRHSFELAACRELRAGVAPQPLADSARAICGTSGGPP
ncbi:metallophosphoesterase [Ideonella sp. DXS29W]|uniref:Metallophosphoesterase n=1 Tax=Ideonella lacteola TaxID=2984193 RepID=A0ABU9BL54_9BURK